MKVTAGSVVRLLDRVGGQGQWLRVAWVSLLAC
eukprot:COSAG01_NODE_247_length_20443_cov_52.339543_11_plen_33_part_00